MRPKLRYQVAFACVCALILSSSLVATAKQSGEENASNPLAKVKNIDKIIELYLDGLAGIGGDRPYDWGVGTGLRFKY